MGLPGGLAELTHQKRSGNKGAAPRRARGSGRRRRRGGKGWTGGWAGRGEDREGRSTGAGGVGDGRVTAARRTVGARRTRGLRRGGEHGQGPRLGRSGGARPAGRLRGRRGRTGGAAGRAGRRGAPRTHRSAPTRAPARTSSAEPRSLRPRTRWSRTSGRRRRPETSRTDAAPTGGRRGQSKGGRGAL